MASAAAPIAAVAAAECTPILVVPTSGLVAGNWTARHTSIMMHRPQSGITMECSTCATARREFHPHRHGSATTAGTICESDADQCTLCPYYVIPGLKHHRLLAHGDDRPHSCLLCDYAGRDLTALRTHQRNLHSDVRPYSCAACPFAAKTRWALLRHKAQRHGGSLV